MVYVKPLFVFAAIVASIVGAHLAFWQESMYGSDSNNINSSRVVQSLRGLPFNQWRIHSDIDRPPLHNAITKLPVRGYIDLEIADNKGLPSMGHGLLPNSRDYPVP